MTETATEAISLTASPLEAPERKFETANNDPDATEVTPPSSDTENFEKDDGSNDDNNDDIEIPHEFICPLTMEIFTDPLMNKRGINFERKAIVEWLNRGNDTCPLTREKLSYSSLIPNAKLRLRVELWKQDHGYQDERRTTYRKGQSDDEDSDDVGHNLFIGMIEAPPNSLLEIRWTRELEQLDGQGGSEHRRRRRSRRRHRDGQSRSTGRITNTTNVSNTNTPLAPSPTGVSPAMQRRRLAGLLGDALNVVRRTGAMAPPLTSDSNHS